MQICLLPGRQFEDTFDNTQWGEPHNCIQWEYTFSKLGGLITHLKTHSGEKLPKCNWCEFVFSHASHL